jgi:hypothetical protein
VRRLDTAFFLFAIAQVLCAMATALRGHVLTVSFDPID